MFWRVRTTIRLDDDLLTAAKKRAADTGRTLTRLIEDALRRELAPTQQGWKVERYRVEPVGGRGMRPGVDLDDTAALIDLMERTET